MGRLIDADICLNKAWQNFYKQEDEHEKNIDGYDIMRDQFYEQSGFECCQQTIVNAPTVEAIPKADYEARLKADMVAMLKELKYDLYHELCKEIHGKEDCPCTNQTTSCLATFRVCDANEAIYKVIQQKINELKGDKK